MSEVEARAIRRLQELSWSLRWKTAAKRYHRLFKAELGGSKRLHVALVDARRELLEFRKRSMS